MTSPLFDAAGDFGPFGGRVWLNCAHQGPLPRVAADAVERATGWKRAPSTMPPGVFDAVPAGLRSALAGLVGGRPENIVLGNSASYGLHVLAHGLPWREGDEVLAVAGDFPATVLPWTGFEALGMTVRTVRPSRGVPTADELAAGLSAATRVFVASWVNSFTGEALDVDAIGAVCRARGVRFVLNGSQAVGARPLDVSSAPVDALTSCGFKWLCGPYGTGFLWLSDAMVDAVDYNQNYWLTAQASRPLDAIRDYPVEAVAGAGARRWDVFGTANFLNFASWTESVRYLADTVGVDRAAAHDQALVDRLVSGLTEAGLEVTSPHEGPARSTLVLADAGSRERSAALHARLAEAGVDVALREGRLRFSPHVHNTAEDVERALEAVRSG